MRHFKTYLLCAILLSGCSGSSLDSDTASPKAKVVVNAGNNRTVDENTTVILTAQAQGQSAELTYQWRVTPNLDITHDNKNAAEASFVAPLTTSILNYVFTLEVSDALGNKGSDTVEYQIMPVNLLPVAIIQASQYSGLANNQYPAGVQITLDGSDSYDPDGENTAGAIAAYKWQQTAGAAVLEGISTDGTSLVFTSPVLDIDNSLAFSLTVTDAEGAQNTQTINLTVQSASNTLPQADAGLDHQLTSGEIIVLAGKANTSVAAAEPLQYRWLNDSLLKPVIEQAQQLLTYAIAPKVSSPQVITFTLEVTDASGNKVEDSVNIDIRPQLARPINDTGIILQATDQLLSAEQQLAYPGQDGQRGRDMIAANNLADKAGRGEQGFDFTRLNALGDEVDDTATDWSCVRDNVSGLVWEVKSASGTTNLHSNSHTYSWYLSENDGDPSGVQSNAAATCSLAECNSTTYIEAVNQQGLCNFNDWRLPSHQELLSLVHFGHDAAPMIDAEYFPHTTAGLGSPVWYWTNQSSADGAAGEISNNAWAVDFSSGNDNFLNKATPVRIRLVRAGR